MFNNQYPTVYDNSNERYGFLGPFILGGITGGLVAPFFNNNNNYGYNPPPPMNSYNYYYPPYNYYYPPYIYYHR